MGVQQQKLMALRFVAKACINPAPFIRRASGIATCRGILAEELNAISEAGTWKSERVITSPQAAKIRVEGTDGQLLNFCANNYLGLSVSFLSEGAKNNSIVACMLH